MLSARNFPIGRAARPLWLDYGIAVGAFGVALLARVLLEGLGDFYYLPMVPAVMLTAIVTGRRGPTLLTVMLGIVSNVLQVSRVDVIDTTANALLFFVVSWMIAGMCWRLRDAQQRARDLSRRLARRNQMLDAILDSAPVVTIDRAGRIRFLTRPARAILGVAEGAAIGDPLSAYVDGFVVPTAGEDRDDETLWVGRRGDRSYPLRIQAGLMPDDLDGHHATLFLTDLTQAQAADDRARELHTQLNRVWRLNSLGEMAASLAHELNQPLSAATNYLHAAQTDIEKAGLAGQSASRTMELAKSQLLRAGAIIRRMRELLAHESRSMGSERVTAMIADMQGMLGMIERNAGVVIEYRIDDHTDHVRAERIQFQQAMVNLIRNAIEALDGRDDRRVRVTGAATGPDKYQLTVEDSGGGIAPGKLDTIFRPLMTTKSAGMGLGLSVTRTIVESHGGTLAVGQSDMGGAAFSFTLAREHELEEA